MEIKEEEIAKIAEGVGKKVRADIDKEFVSLKEEIKKAQESKDPEEIKGLEKKMEKLIADMDGLSKKMERGDQSDGFLVKSFEHQVHEGLTKKSADLKTMISDRNMSVELELKAAGNMFVRDGNGPLHATLPSNYGGTLGLTSFDSNVVELRRREPFLRQLFRSFSTDKPLVGYVEKKNRDGAAAMTAEGAKKSQIDFDLIEATAKVNKVTAFVKATKEALDDIPYLRSLINTELVEAIELTLDEQLWSGDGTGTNLKGILTYASALPITSSVNPTFFENVDSANLFDVLRVAQAIQTSKFFSPTHVIVNPLDKTMMELTKDKNGNYVIPPFGTSDRMGVSGMRVVSNVLVTPGTFLIGDMTKANLAIRENITMSVGYENDDFTKNFITILAEMRAGLFVKSNEIDAFTKGTFATLIAAIDKPVESEE